MPNETKPVKLNVMILSISTTHQPATDLGYLLHKNPSKTQSFTLTFGEAHIVYSEVSNNRCTANLILDIDPIGLVRGNGGFDQYVNDRPYTASSFLSVALARVLREAMAGRSKERQTLAQTPIPLELRLSSVPSRGGADLLRRLFVPLGYQLEVEPLPLDARFPSWGESSYWNVTLRTTATLASALTHLYVLIPVLDDEKHYWVGDDEVDKLLRFGSGWLETHPEREEIARRYLKHRRSLMQSALAQLEPELEEVSVPVPEKQQSLHQQRLETVMQKLLESQANTILDLGCGEGKLIWLLVAQKQFKQILGADVSHKALEIASARLKLPNPRVQLLQSSITYLDSRLKGFDAITLIEVIEHLELYRLEALERNVFGFLQAQTVIISTPNTEYNTQWENLAAGTMRHKDHRFEWTRAEFATWANRIVQEYAYTVSIEGIGLEVQGVGSPSQIAIFKKEVLA
jgi:3' terminal RNA ribose 2'-O-methyltransferase Hen1